MQSSVEKKLMKTGGPGVFEKKIAELTQLESETSRDKIAGLKKSLKKVENRPDIILTEASI